MSNDPSSPTHWLSQIRLDLQGGEVALGTYQSTLIDVKYDIVTTCNYQTCNGCVDLNVMRLCYGAQQCTIARCIGTLTNQNRPLCGIGQTGQAVFTTTVVLVNAAWNIFTETLTTIIGLGLDDTTQTGIQIKWIDDSFFSAICSAKDAVATFISIFTSVINFIVQSVTSRPISYMEMNAQKVDSNFQVLFTYVFVK